MKRLMHTCLPTFVFDARAEAERELADEIVALVRTKPETVLGLATGDTPVGVYRDLHRAHVARAVSFARASTFNLDEYLDLARDDPRRFRRWMEAHLFQHIDLPPENAHLPESTSSADDPVTVAERYEAAIRAAGGLDLQVLGIGRNGHLGFNEPGSSRASRTRVVDLHPLTRADAAGVFGGLEHVPKRAITMGVGTIFEAARLRVLAFGARKAEIVRRTLHDPMTSAFVSTFLREHGDVKLFVDREAAAQILDEHRAR